MCFSVGASFTASGVLAVIGFLALKKAPSRYKLFAAIPMLFAIQQFSEGVVWLVLTGMPEGSPLRLPFFIITAPLGFLAKTLAIPEYIDLIKTGSILTFLFFALVIWPSWIPFACWRFEDKKRRKRVITALLVLGLIISGTLLYDMFAYGVKAAVVEGHIVYTMTNIIPYVPWVGTLLYTLATVGTLFITSLPQAYLLGGAIMVSEILAWYFWHAAFVSTWCFFAAILSVIVLSIIPEKA